MKFDKGTLGDPFYIGSGSYKVYIYNNDVLWDLSSTNVFAVAETNFIHSVKHHVSILETYL